MNLVAGDGLGTAEFAQHRKITTVSPPIEGMLYGIHASTVTPRSCDLLAFSTLSIGRSTEPYWYAATCIPQPLVHAADMRNSLRPRPLAHAPHPRGEPVLLLHREAVAGDREKVGVDPLDPAHGHDYVVDELLCADPAQEDVRDERLLLSERSVCSSESMRSMWCGLYGVHGTKSFFLPERAKKFQAVISASRGDPVPGAPALTQAVPGGRWCQRA